MSLFNFDCVTMFGFSNLAYELDFGAVIISHFGLVGLVGFGLVVSNSDYKAILVQLQLQLPARTELGNSFG